MGLETIALIGLGVGTGLKVGATLRQGKQAQDIADARAAIDRRNAEAVRRRTVEEARIERIRGVRLIEEQKSLAAAGNIRINIGAPLVIRAATERAITQDIGFILETGREESAFFRSRAALEKARGKALRKKSVFDAITQGVQGFATIAFLGITPRTNRVGSLVGRGGRSISLRTPGLFAGTNAAPGFGVPTTGGGRFV